MDNTIMEIDTSIELSLEEEVLRKLLNEWRTWMKDSFQKSKKDYTKKHFNSAKKNRDKGKWK